MKSQSEEKPWFVQWFDENYRTLYSHRNSAEAQKQVRLIISTLRPAKSRSILDLCCGEGRYTALFRDMGYSIIGLDLSETLIRFGKQRDPALDLVVGDMRAIPGHFDIILSLFTSFGYFDSDLENETVLHSVYAALRPGGIYWLDFLNPVCVEQNLVPETLTQISAGIEVLEKRKVENGRIIKDIHFRSVGVKEEEYEQKEYKESVRLFSREQLEEMFVRSRLQLLHCFGDYQGHPWSACSERTILVGRKIS